MKNIFVYGSLMFDDVWNRVVQRHYEKQAALLPGFKRLSVKGESYPGLVKSFNSTVEGVIYFDVTAKDIKRLDKFEGKYYKKIPVTVLSDSGREVEAETYVFNRRNRRLLGNTLWDPVRFQQHHLHKYMMKHNDCW